MGSGSHEFPKRTVKGENMAHDDEARNEDPLFDPELHGILSPREEVVFSPALTPEQRAEVAKVWDKWVETDREAELFREAFVLGLCKAGEQMCRVILMAQAEAEKKHNKQE
jgi:hypothetical protein